MAAQAQSSDQEIEVKFYLSRREEMEVKLSSLGKLIAPRVHEVNLRLDTPEHGLAATGRLLRLRQDARARLTYKGAGGEQGGARLRQELEVTVSDFDTALSLLEALGYEVVLMYEKQRTTYQLGDVEAVLDETPLGDFLELEGPDGESLRQAAARLGLDWQARNLDSYTFLFGRALDVLGLHFRDMTFENFAGLSVSPEAMGVKAADGQ
jgi:adenylate cyclase class 2